MPARRAGAAARRRRAPRRRRSRRRARGGRAGSRARSTRRRAGARSAARPRRRRPGRRARASRPRPRPAQHPSGPQASPSATTCTTGCARLPAAPQELAEDLGRLRAGRAERAVDDEERHARGCRAAPRCARPRGPRRRSGRRRAASRTSSSGSPTSTARRSSVGRVADRLALGEVGAHQALLHRVLRAVRRGEVHEPVGVERVAAAGDVEAERRGPSSAATSVMRCCIATRLLAARAVLLGEVRGAVDLALARRGRVELEAPPRDGDVVAVLEPGERGLEAALADVAPGAGDVRPDLDVHVRSFDRCSRPTSRVAAPRRGGAGPRPAPPASSPSSTSAGGIVAGSMS